MQYYIAILRGINVSGQKKIKMEDLRKSLGSLGYEYLKTYIQSGNIIFQSSETNQSKLMDQINSNINNEFGFDVPVIVRNANEWLTVLNSNPFTNGQKENYKQLYVTFLANKPEKQKIDQLTSFFENHPEELVFSTKEIYLLYPDGYGKSKLNNNLIERKLGVTATTRNWNTVLKISEMLKKT